MADHANTPGGKGGQPPDPTQEAAQLARKHVKRAVEVVAEVLENADRQSPARLAAAKMILEMAGELQPAPAEAPPVVDSLDELAAARERLRAAREAERK